MAYKNQIHRCGVRRVSFHVGRLPASFYVLVGLRCPHIDKHELPTNHIMVAN